MRRASLKPTFPEFAVPATDSAICRYSPWVCRQSPKSKDQVNYLKVELFANRGSFDVFHGNKFSEIDFLGKSTLSQM